MPGLGFQPVEDGDRILHQPRQVPFAPELSDQSGGMPGATVGEQRFLDQQHVLGAVAGQMIGHRGADGAATDDQDMDVTIRMETHRCTVTP